MSSSTDVPPLAKYLASTDKKTRDKAVKNLSIFLSNGTGNAIPDLEMAKLWKGIFYCFWMSDKPLVQQALASELAEIILTITDVPSSLNFLRGFWTTMVREWSGIDRLRMDKYYMLVRRFVNASFRLLLRAEWDSISFEEYNSILSGPSGPLCFNDIRIPASLAFHLAETYLEELDKVLGDISMPNPPPVPLFTTLSPFLSLAARTQAKTTYKHLREVVFDPLLAALKVTRPENIPSRKRQRLSASSLPNIIANACVSSPRQEGLMSNSATRTALLQKIFEVASEEETRDSNRRKMYDLYKDAIEDDEGSEG
ncbi:nucleolar protein,Nop52-domain-containing protein [Hygrophoropsis aurantiaca]|uniref:Nucleolar protein,Nop52-domain-containing protein n=1 Tax=Hygrophoropsis aurantiaca TaxID=72124 RepID=A0ACB8ASJ7_9AGAM|nr:nucleolar protein,Nop52-domain-containing protein [Hygrophoropsis aurantiaca]